ncbi:MAG: hypothetical protein Q8R40_02700 [bacterium]|nr:hypothetical protein [bacterium]
MLKFLSTYPFFSFIAFAVFVTANVYFGFWLNTPPLIGSAIATAQTLDKHPCDKPAHYYLIIANRHLEIADKPASIYEASVASSFMQMYEICSHIQQEEKKAR